MAIAQRHDHPVNTLLLGVCPALQRQEVGPHAWIHVDGRKISTLDLFESHLFDASEEGLHGKNAEEQVGLVKRGLSPQNAIRAATVNAADLLGWQDSIGAIEAGKYADLIGVEGDPLTNIAVLEKVKFVMKGGKVVKDARPR